MTQELTAQEVVIRDIFTVAARLKKLNQHKEFMGSKAFTADFTVLLDLIDKLKRRREKQD